MENGPWTALGAFGWFLGVLVVMTAAMMFPSVAPTVGWSGPGIVTYTDLPLPLPRGLVSG